MATNRLVGAYEYRPVILGRVTNTVTRAGEAGAVVTFTGGTGGSSTADENGYYRLMVNNGWTGTVSASVGATNGSGTFTPASRSYVNVTNTVTNHN